MKVLFVSEFYPDQHRPQYCIFLEQQAQALRDLGNEVNILIFKAGVRVKEEVNFLYWQNGLKVFGWQYPSKKIKDKLLLSPTNKALFDFLIRECYDVVSLHLGNLGALKTVANICFNINTKITVHYHGLNVWRDYDQNFKSRIYNSYSKLIKKNMLKKSAAAVGVSNLVCEVIKEEFEGKTCTVYNGVDESIFTYDVSKLQKNRALFQILCVANLIPIKGHKYLIHAVADCIKRGYRIELRVVGEGSEFEDLWKECRALNITNNVIFTGALPYSEVAIEMKSADMFILPSFFEAFGCVYVEAMASGVLTCGCWGNGAEEIITDKHDGLLVHNKNANDISDAIIFAVENPEKARKIAMNGIKRAQEFTWSKSARTLMSIYNEIVENF